MKTVFFNHTNTPPKRWLIIDANNCILGRLASRIAFILQGKDKPYYTPNFALGDCIIVINSQKIYISGKKAFQKFYWSHTGYPGGIKKKSFLKLKEQFPNRIIYYAVRNMLPKNKLRSKMLKQLKIYPDANHMHHAQSPKHILNITKQQHGIIL
jgi:large subunit ribosomal protein L13